MNAIKLLQISVFISAFTMTLVLEAQAQKTNDEEETEIIQDLWGMGKKAIIEEYMQFNEGEAQLFWPIYEDYAEKRKTLSADRITLLQDYVNSYTNLTNEKAELLTQELFKNNAKLDKLQLKYYKQLKKAISPLRASQFMQLEGYIQAVVRYEVQDAIPFIGELEDKKMNN